MTLIKTILFSLLWFMSNIQCMNPNEPKSIFIATKTPHAMPHAISTPSSLNVPMREIAGGIGDRCRPLPIATANIEQSIAVSRQHYQTTVASMENTVSQNLAHHQKLMATHSHQNIVEKTDTLSHELGSTTFTLDKMLGEQDYTTSALLTTREPIIETLPPRAQKLFYDSGTQFIEKIITIRSLEGALDHNFKTIHKNNVEAEKSLNKFASKIQHLETNQYILKTETLPPLTAQAQKLEDAIKSCVASRPATANMEKNATQELAGCKGRTLVQQASNYLVGGPDQQNLELDKKTATENLRNLDIRIAGLQDQLRLVNQKIDHVKSHLETVHTGLQETQTALREADKVTPLNSAYQHILTAANLAVFDKGIAQYTTQCTLTENSKKLLHSINCDTSNFDQITCNSFQKHLFEQTTDILNKTADTFAEYHSHPHVSTYAEATADMCVYTMDSIKFGTAQEATAKFEMTSILYQATCAAVSFAKGCVEGATIGTVIDIGITLLVPQARVAGLVLKGILAYQALSFDSTEAINSFLELSFDKKAEAVGSACGLLFAPSSRLGAAAALNAKRALQSVTKVIETEVATLKASRALEGSALKSADGLAFSNKTPFLTSLRETNSVSKPRGVSNSSGKRTAGSTSSVGAKLSEMESKVLAEATTVKHPHGSYKDADYHNINSSGPKSKCPRDGQAALDKSIKIKNDSPHRVAIQDGEFVELRITREFGNNPAMNEYHGNRATWDNLNEDAQKILIKKNLVTRKGKIIAS